MVQLRDQFKKKSIFIFGFFDNILLSGPLGPLEFSLLHGQLGEVHQTLKTLGGLQMYKNEWVINGCCCKILTIFTDGFPYNSSTKTIYSVL